MDDTLREIYQQVIIEHNKSPRNFRKLNMPSHAAEGYNPLCGDHLHVYLNVTPDQVIEDITFEGDGCAISRASASMMTQALKGKKIEEAHLLFEKFHQLLLGKLTSGEEARPLGKLTIFSGIWQYPSRVKCASLCWHTMEGALKNEGKVSTE